MDEKTRLEGAGFKVMTMEEHVAAKAQGGAPAPEVVNPEKNQPAEKVVKATRENGQVKQPAPEEGKTTQQPEKQEVKKEAPKQEITFGGEEEPEVDAPFNVKEVFGQDLSFKQVKEFVNNYKTVQGELEDLKAKNPFFNERTKAYDEAMRNGVDEKAFFAIQSSDPEKLTNIDKVVKRMMWEKGLSEDKAKRLVEAEYGLHLRESEDMTEEELEAMRNTKELNEIKLEAAAAEAHKFLKDKIVETMKPVEKAKFNGEAVEKAWGEKIGSMVSKFGKINIGEFSHSLSKEEISELAQDTLETLKSSLQLAGRNEASPESLDNAEMVRDMAEKLYWQNYGPRLAKSLATWSAQELLKYKNNPSDMAEGAAEQQGAVNQNTPSGGMTLAEAVRMGY